VPTTISHRQHSFFRPLPPLLPAAYVFLWLFVLAGCAAVPGRAPSGFTPPAGSRKVENVPFYPQTDDQCGPSSLAMVLNYYGEEVSPDEIAGAIFRENIRGTVTLDMVLYARQKAFSARWYSGSLDDIQRAVDGGVPLIVMVDIGFAGVSKNHYMVVVGYSPQGLVANSGKDREKLIGWGRFLTGWERTGRWTLRIELKKSESTG